MSKSACEIEPFPVCFFFLFVKAEQYTMSLRVIYATPSFLLRRLPLLRGYFPSFFLPSGPKQQVLFAEES